MEPNIHAAACEFLEVEMVARIGVVFGEELEISWMSSCPFSMRTRPRRY